MLEKCKNTFECVDFKSGSFLRSCGKILNLMVGLCSPPQAPQTPEPSCSAVLNSPVNGKVADQAISSATDSHGSCATSSSGGFSAGSTVGQPQPVEELHSLVHAEQERQIDSQQARGGLKVDGQAKDHLRNKVAGLDEQ